MKILIVPHNIPYPLVSGGNISQFAILNEMQFRNDVEISLCLIIKNQKEFDAVEELKGLLKKIEIILIDDRPNKMQIYFSLLMRTFKKFINSLSRIVKVESIKDVNDDFDLKYRFIPQVKSTIVTEGLSKIFEKRKFDLVQVEFFEFLDIVNLIPSSIPSVFVHHEIRFQIYQRGSEVSLKSNSYKNYIVQYIKTIESAILLKYNHIITFSKIDHDILTQTIDTPISCIPFPVLKSEFCQDYSFHKRDKLIFIGGSEHYPNLDAMEWFIRVIYVDIWKEIKIPLIVIGNWPERTRNKLKSIPGVTFVGFVKDLSYYYKTSISVIPLRIGSGIRAKILYAMAQRSPVISSAIGIEGIPIEDKKHFFLAENSKDYIEAIKLLTQKTNECDAITNKAYDYVFANYHPENIINQRIELYNTIINK